ncbi:MAG: hypothetical protein M1829_003436 [Trizodia sp. TS-e1964]|nr:MAG: hypothetical protein M1829_003436 [Trizodia sp. TS-e1964]
MHVQASVTAESVRSSTLSPSSPSSPSAPPWISNDTAESILNGVHYAYPIAILALFLTSFTLHSILTASSATTAVVPSARGPGGKPLPRTILPGARARRAKAQSDFTPLQRGVFNWLSVLLIGTFLGNAVSVILHALTRRPWWCGQATAIYLVACVFVYALVLISLIDTRPSPTVAHLVTWASALLLELALFAAALSLYSSAHRELNSLKPKHGKSLLQPSGWEITEIVLDVSRVGLLACLTAFYFLFSYLRSRRERQAEQGEANEPTETTHLLNGNGNGNGSGNGNGHGAPNPLASPAHAAPGYGAVPPNAREQESEQPLAAGFYRPIKAPSKSWWEYIMGYSLFFPYLWPSKSLRLQAIVVLCFLIVVMQRGINVLVPNQVGIVTDILSGENGEPPRLPWKEIVLYIVFRFLQGGTGILGAARSALWIPISQYSYQALSTSAFEHVHSLSLDFHLGKKTGEVLSALSKGNSINTFLEQVTFQVVPMLVDLGVAIGYFLVVFDAYYALVVAIVTFCYLYFTIRMAQWRADIRREMVNAGREEDAVKNDSMVSYETVKYFNAEAYEFNRYRDAVKAFQSAEYRVMISLNVMNVTQNLVFTLGLLITCFIAAYQVSVGERKVGDFVALLTYMAQLQGPLNFFGTFYRSIQSAMINSERMLELFKEQPTVLDQPGVEELSGCEGEIRFDNVGFAYDMRKPALQGLSFTCPPGTTTALVGESGGGKSTVFRLLFRFYNCQTGSIQVDGRDVQSLSIDSLRKHIGVVPQDTVLFNETLMYNLKYANPNATDDDVFAACQAASIHHKILTFPDGYNTKVGERGLRLSGGEKQRVAIARTILKNPRIILLDEATAALDSETEMHIQSALNTLSMGRTMLVIAHRLSTITTADQILCIHNGKVDEAGTHEELLQLKGRYASMWKKQIRAERAAEEAQKLKVKADKLKSKQGINIEGDSNSEEASGDNHSGNNSEAEGPSAAPSPPPAH